MRALLLIDRLELAKFVGVIPPARGALIVEVPPDVIPAESAYLLGDMGIRMVRNKRKEEKVLGNWVSGAHLILALARLEVEIRDIHLLEAERTLLRILHRTKDKDM